MFVQNSDRILNERGLKKAGDIPLFCKMRIKPTPPPLKGTIYFRDALAIESTVTVAFNAVLERNAQLLLFQFEDCHFCFNVADLHLSSRNYKGIDYTDNYEGQECTLTFFYIQEMTIKDEPIFFVSGVFDLGEGLAYRVFRIHGYFSANRNELKANPNFWFK